MMTGSENTPNTEIPKDDQLLHRQQRWVMILVHTGLLLTPRGLSPKLARLWAQLIVRAVLFAILFTAATLVGVLIAGGLSVNLAPHRLGALKWPGVICMGLLGWRAVYFFPQVWQNRRDDNFAVAFVAILVFLFAFAIWNVFIV
jgi:hypothetical protein